MRSELILHVIFTHTPAHLTVAAAAGHALVDYARDHEIDLVVVGSRGLGALKRSLMSMMGLGSTSDHM